MQLRFFLHAWVNNGIVGFLYHMQTWVDVCVGNQFKVQRLLEMDYILYLGLAKNLEGTEDECITTIKHFLVMFMWAGPQWHNG